MKNKKIELIIDKIFETLELGTVETITYIKSSQNLVYLVKTDKNSYYIKKYSKDAIKNEKELLNKKIQIAFSEKLKEMNVPAVLPLTFNNRYFIKYNKDYYLIFSYSALKPITEKELDIKKIKKMANILAIIHKLDIQSNLPCHYKKININFSKYLKKYAKLDNDLFKTLNENYRLLEELINTCNNNISKVKNNLCTTHNDYKLLNILWEKEYMYLIDFDAAAMSNPTVSFAEAAFSLSRQNGNLNQDFYREFVSTYTKKYGIIEDDFGTCLSVAMNGKLKWLEYLMSKCTKKDLTSIEDTINMLIELRLFVDNKENMLTIYNDVIKNKKTKKKKHIK